MFTSKSPLFSTLTTIIFHPLVSIYFHPPPQLVETKLLISTKLLFLLVIQLTFPLWTTYIFCSFALSKLSSHTPHYVIRVRKAATGNSKHCNIYNNSWGQAINSWLTIPLPSQFLHNLAWVKYMLKSSFTQGMWGYRGSVKKEEGKEKKLLN